MNIFDKNVKRSVGNEHVEEEDNKEDNEETENMQKEANSNDCDKGYFE